jgi:hypothetical protein
MREAATVIPDAAERRSGIHIPCASATINTGGMDSGTRFARPEMTPENFAAAC